MISAMVILLGVVALEIYAGIWFVEAVALGFFGVAFLTKADVYRIFFCDSPNEDKETDNA